MSYGTCVSAGEKAIGLDQEEKKNGRREGKENKPQSKTGVDQPPTSLRGFDGAWIQSSRPCGQTIQICLHTCLFIHRKPLPREKRTQAWTRALDSNWSELRPVLSERTLWTGVLYYPLRTRYSAQLPILRLCAWWPRLWAEEKAESTCFDTETDLSFFTCAFFVMQSW